MRKVRKEYRGEDASQNIKMEDYQEALDVEMRRKRGENIYRFEETIEYLLRYEKIWIEKLRRSCNLK